MSPESHDTQPTRHPQSITNPDVQHSHLLGKKSWNVYNASNVARVRRDEEAAAAREEAREQRLEDEDAARRMAVLRGEDPPPPPPQVHSDDDKGYPPDTDRSGRHGSGGGRKRKRRGEDDTDFEMRVARERAEAGSRAAELLAGGGGPREGEGARGAMDAPLVGADGHIALFAAPDEREARRAEERAAKRRREVDEREKDAMRFADAAGRGGDGLAEAGPWYLRDGKDKGKERGVGKGGSGPQFEGPTKDVWGREDPRRRDREKARLDASDPLAMMKRGAAKVREVEKDRRRDAEERARELKALRKEERRREKKRRREGTDRDGDDLEGFSLDAPSKSKGRESRDRDSRKEDEYRNGDAREREEPRHNRSHKREASRDRDRRHRHDVDR